MRYSGAGSVAACILRRRLSGRTDADQLAALTRLPAGLWVGLFGVVAVCALAFSTLWLVRW